MKRRVMLLLLFLVGGVIVNVAVAWTLPHFTRVRWSDAGPPNVDDTAWWQANAPAGREVRDAPAHVIHNKGLGFRTVYMIELRRTERSQPTAHTFERKMLGWPMLSLQSSIWNDPTQRATLRGIVFFLSKDWPFAPMWPGFAVNTLFYAFILWLLFAAPFALRRRRRIRRGLCPKCANPVGTSAVCTECGAAVPLSLLRERARVREPTQ